MPKPPTKPAPKTNNQARSQSKNGTAPEKAKSVKNTSQREVLYPTAEMRAQMAEGAKCYYVECLGDTAITVKQVEELLGWTEVPSSEGAHFRDENGKWIFCTNNTINREIRKAKLDELVQVHLTRKWHFNGEDILIGMYGSILNGQKSMISLKLADQIRKKDPNGRGRLWGDKPVTMDKGVKFGLEETDDIVNTLDTAQPRSISDVMYRSEYFRSMPLELRSAASRISNYAVRLVWSRTGAGTVAFTPHMTHDACTAFLERHQRLIEAIKWAAEENNAKVHVTLPTLDNEGKQRTAQRGKIDVLIEPSRAAALLYLMGMSATVQTLYRYGPNGADGRMDPDYVPTEECADDSLWHKAEDFWASLINDDADTEAVRECLASLENKETGRKPSADEKITVLWKAWTQYIVEPKKGKKQSLVAVNLRPNYRIYTDPESGEEERDLINEWDFGGIDIYRKLEPDNDGPEDGRDEEPPVDSDGDGIADEEYEGEPMGATLIAPRTRANNDIDADGDEDGDEDDLAAAGDIIERDPTPDQIATLLAANRARDDESPEEERRRRAEIDKVASVREQDQKDKLKMSRLRAKNRPAVATDAD